MKQVEVFDGNQLYDKPVGYNCPNPQYLFVGSDVNGSRVFVPIDDNLLSRHMVLLGGIGTGKTNTFFQIMLQIRKKLSFNDIAIVFDTKGDFYKAFYEPGDIVISNDELARGPRGTDYWNIFNEIEKNEHMEENIVEISKTLFNEKIENTNQPFFPNAAKDIFSAVLTHFIKNPDTCNTTNEGLRSFLNGASGEELRKILAQYPEFKSMVSYIADDRSPQTQGVLSEMQQLVREIFLGNFKKSGTLSMRNIVRNKGGKFVFIEYDIGVGRMLSPIYSLLFDMAIKEALCRSKSDGNVFFVTDEFSLLPNLSHVDDAVNFGRSLGIKFMIGIQNVNQIFDNYGEERGKSLLSGFLTSVCFRVTDEASRNYIKGLFGTNRKKEVFMSSVSGRGVTEQIRDSNVVEDWDVLRLRIGEAIIGLPGIEPFIFKFDKV